MAPAETLKIECWVAPAPRSVMSLVVHLPPGSTVGQAIEATGWLGQVPGLDASVIQDERARGVKQGAWAIAIWGRKVGWDHPVRDGDRVELLRSLTADPKEARRVRYRAQGEKLPKGFYRPKAKPETTG